MNTLQQMVKLAKTDRAYLQSLMQLAKTAADGSSKTRFDESVPATDMPNQQDPSLQQGAGRMPQAGDPSQASNGQMQYPDDTAALQGQQVDNPPEEAGARAAQAFIGPDVMQAAMSGDANAMQLIAMVAASLANAAQNTRPQAPQDQQSQDLAQQTMDQAGLTPEEQMAMQESGQMPGGQQPDAQMAPAVPQSPEEQVANMIVAPQPAPAAQPMQPTTPGDQGQGGAPGGAPQAGGQAKKKEPFKSDERKAGDKERQGESFQEKTSSLEVTPDELMSLIGVLAMAQ